MWSWEYIILCAVLAVAAFIDVRTHRIPNWLTYPTILLGFSLAFFNGGSALLANHLLGFFAAGLPFLALFLNGSLGGGDVKLMAGVGAFLGFPLALNALLSSIMIGGLFALLILIWQGRILGLAKYAWQTLWHKVGILANPPASLPPHKDKFPFGIAIAIGTALIIVPPGWLQSA